MNANRPNFTPRVFPAAPLGRDTGHAVVFAPRMPREDDILRFLDRPDGLVAECLDSRRADHDGKTHFRHIVREQLHRRGLRRNR